MINIDKEQVRQMLDKYAFYTLYPREEKALRLTFGINDDNRARTFEESSAELKVNVDTVKNIVARALSKLDRSKQRDEQDLSGNSEKAKQWLEKYGQMALYNNESKVFKLRYGSEINNPKAYIDIARELNMNPKTVISIINTAWGKLERRESEAAKNLPKSISQSMDNAKALFAQQSKAKQPSADLGKNTKQGLDNR